MSSQSSSSVPLVDEFDFDESTRTVTAIAWAKAQGRLPISGRRVYGSRRSSSGVASNTAKEAVGPDDMETAAAAEAVTGADHRPIRRPSKKRNMIDSKSKSKSNAMFEDCMQLSSSLGAEDEELKDMFTEAAITSHRPPIAPRGSMPYKTAAAADNAAAALEDENMHPNSTVTHSSMTKPCTKHANRSRPTSPPFSVDHSASTFSSLSKAGYVAQTWILAKTPCSTPLQKDRAHPRTFLTSARDYLTSTPHMSIDGRGGLELESSSASITHYGTTSPTPSISSSSRKRGSCESPLWIEDDPDDMISLYNHQHIPSTMSTCDDDNLSQPNTPQNASSSHFLSPSSTFIVPSPNTVQKMMQKREAEGIFNLDTDGIHESYYGVVVLDDDHHHEGRFKNICQGESSDEEDECNHSMSEQEEELSDKRHDSEIQMATSIDESDDDIHFKSISPPVQSTCKVELLVSRPPTQVRRMSSTGSASFLDSVFAPVDSGGTSHTQGTFIHPTLSEQLIKNPLLVFDSMSSYDDLKYLVKELRRLKSGKTFTSFGAFKNWTVPLLHSWSSERRYGFITWTTRDLGFRLRTGGSSVLFLQIHSSSGLEVLRSLEIALLEHKKRQVSQRTLGCDSVVNNCEDMSLTHYAPFTSQIVFNKPPVHR